MKRKCAEVKTGIWCSQFALLPVLECRNTTGIPLPPVSIYRRRTPGSSANCPGGVDCEKLDIANARTTIAVVSNPVSFMGFPEVYETLRSKCSRGLKGVLPNVQR